MFAYIAALFVLCQAVQGGVVSTPSVVPAPAVVPAPLPAARIIAAPAAAPLIAAAPAPLVTASAPITAYAKAVPQAVAPFASSVNLVARGPFLPYAAVGAPVVSPYVETFSAPLVARRIAPVAAPLVAGPAPIISTVV